MSETNMRKIARRRLARMQRDGKAVSPVVATLILILVAVAAAAALYLWLVAWQGGVTAGIGKPGAQSTMSIGGSSSVFPFDQFAVAQFEANNSGIVISNNQGGSGAGMAAVCSGQVDIGASSAAQTLDHLQTAYGCPSTVVEETVAYDAVDVIVPTANVNHIYAMDQTTILAIYVSAGGGPSAWSTAAGYSQGVAFSSGAYAYPTTDISGVAHACDNVGVAVPTCPFTILPSPTGVYKWNQIPACTPQETVAQGCVGGPQQWVGITGGLDAAGGSTACGWTVCGSNAATIQVWHRLDPGGTEQSFTARILGIGASSAVPASGTTASTTYLQFTGCPGTGQLNACTTTTTGYSAGTGNPGVIAGVSANTDTVGFASDGLAITAGSGVTPIAFAGPGQPTPVYPTVGKTIPRGSSGTSCPPAVPRLDTWAGAHSSTSRPARRRERFSGTSSG